MFFIFPAFADMCEIENSNFKLDNPWLCLKAVQDSYPDITGNLCFDTEVNDWCIDVRGEKIYWANGRLLKKEDINDWEKWQPFISYLYKEKPPEPELFTESMIKTLSGKKFIHIRQAEPSPNYTFQSLVYEGSTRKEILKHIRRFNFLGKEVWVHKRIIAPLSRVQQKIYIKSRTDKKIKYFLKTLHACWGFNWRVIADSGKLSNHSWGAAVDIVPVFHSEVKTYWFWEAEYNKKWMYIRPAQRWSPPAEVIKIFESEGFIWGGKWELWDNIHFEYKPELLYIQDFIFSNNVFKAGEKSIIYGNAEIEKEIRDGTADSAIFSCIAESAEIAKTVDILTERLYKKNKMEEP